MAMISLVKKGDDFEPNFWDIVWPVFVVQLIFWGLFCSFAMYILDLCLSFQVKLPIMSVVGVSVSAFANFIGPLAGISVQKVGYTPLFLFWGLTCSASFFITSYINMPSPHGVPPTGQVWKLFFSYSLLFGVGGGMLSQICFLYMFDQFKDEKNLKAAIGVSTAAVGLGYALWSCVAAYILYPGGITFIQNLYNQTISSDSTNTFADDQDVVDIERWRILFRYYAATGLVMASMSIFVYRVEYKKNIFSIFRRVEAPLTMSLLQESSKAMASETGEVATRRASMADRDPEELEKEDVRISVQRGPSITIEKEAAKRLLSHDKEQDEIYGLELLFSKTDHRAKYLFVSNFLVFATNNIPLKFSLLFNLSISPSTFVLYLTPILFGSMCVLSRFMFPFLYALKLDSFGVMKVIQWGSFISQGILALVPYDDQRYAGFSITVFAVVAVCVSAVFPVLPLRTAELLGRKYNKINLGVQYYAVGFGTLFGSYTGATVFERSSAYYVSIGERPLNGFHAFFLYVAFFYLAAFIWDEIVFEKGFFKYLIRRYCFDSIGSTSNTN